MAEKAGLTLQGEYPVHFFWYDELDHTLVYASSQLRRGNHLESAEWYEKAFALAGLGTAGSRLFSSTERRCRFYLDAARAWSRADETRRAKDNLQRAKATGALDMAQVRSDPDLMPLVGEAIG